MGKSRAGMMIAGLTVAVLLAVASRLWAQQAPAAKPGVTAQSAASCSAKLDPSGMVRVAAGDVELAMIELNAHGPQWKHAPQATATLATSSAASSSVRGPTRKSTTNRDTTARAA